MPWTLRLRIPEPTGPTGPTRPRQTWHRLSCPDHEGDDNDDDNDACHGEVVSMTGEIELE